MQSIRGTPTSAFVCATWVWRFVLGEFTEYTGTISYFPNDITKSSVQFTAKVASLDTGVKQRDDHLRSADFFEVEKYPDITFRSTRLERKSEKTFIAYGDLTIKNVTKQIALPVDFYGVVRDSVGDTRLGGSATLNINRLDYGIRWSQVLDNGSLVVDNNVQIELQFEALRQGPKKGAAERLDAEVKHGLGVMRLASALLIASCCLHASIATLMGQGTTPEPVVVAQRPKILPNRWHYRVDSSCVQLHVDHAVTWCSGAD